MKLSSSIVDATFRTRTHEVDERSLMAFAAGAGDARPELIDTARPGGLVAHPVFPMTLEWLGLLDVVAELRERAISYDPILLSSPLDYDLRWLGGIHPGDVLKLDVRVTAAIETPEGSALVLEWLSTGVDGAPVTCSRATLMLPDVELVDGSRPEEHEQAGPEARLGHRDATDEAAVDLRSGWSNADAVIRRGRRRIGAPAAHVFSECSGIWNPAYTDKAVALRLGRAFLALPWAGVLSMVVGGTLQLGSADPSWVRRVRAEFGAPVPVPSILEIEAEVPNRPSSSAPLRFRAHLEDGTPVIPSGLLVTETADVDLEAVRARARRERRRLIGAS